MQILLFKAAVIALEVGKCAMEFYGLEDFSLKGDNSPLTKADIASNELITKRLCGIANYKVCSEEAVLDYEERKNLEYFWLIDPLDGTKDFLAKNGGWTINIALIHKNEPILGVVFAPCFNELFIALKGVGSFKYEAAALEKLLESTQDEAVILEFLKTQKIRLDGMRKAEGGKQRADGGEVESVAENRGQMVNVESQNPQGPAYKVSGTHSQGDLSPCNKGEFTSTANLNIKPQSLIACDSMFHSTKETQEFIKKYNLETIKLGSSLKICALAEGVADIYPRFNGTSEWDIAATDIILREAGGKIISIDDKKELVYNKQSLRNPHFIAFAKGQVGGEIYKEVVESL